MSENDNETDAEFPAADSEAPRIEVDEQKPARSWRKTAIKWLIVLLLLGALGAFGYWKFTEWRAADEPAVVDTAPNEVESLRDELRLTREAVTALQAQVEGFQSELEQLNQRTFAVNRLLREATSAEETYLLYGRKFDEESLTR